MFWSLLVRVMIPDLLQERDRLFVVPQDLVSFPEGLQQFDASRRVAAVAAAQRAVGHRRSRSCRLRHSRCCC